jgi:hypothetical protein
MPIISKPSFAARAAIIYVTLGTLINVWSGVWLYYLHNHPPERDALFYWAWCFLLTGVALTVIGLAVGQIGRAARHAELPPEEVTAATAQAELSAAARAPIVAPVNPAEPLAVPVAPTATVVPPASPAAPAATVPPQ